MAPPSAPSPSPSSAPASPPASAEDPETTRLQVYANTWLRDCHVLSPHMPGPDLVDLFARLKDCLYHIRLTIPALPGTRPGTKPATTIPTVPASIPTPGVPTPGILTAKPGTGPVKPKVARVAEAVELGLDTLRFCEQFLPDDERYHLNTRIKDVIQDGETFVKKHGGGGGGATAVSGGMLGAGTFGLRQTAPDALQWWAPGNGNGTRGPNPSVSDPPACSDLPKLTSWLDPPLFPAHELAIPDEKGDEKEEKEEEDGDDDEEEQKYGYPATKDEPVPYAPFYILHRRGGQPSSREGDPGSGDHSGTPNRDRPKHRDRDRPVFPRTEAGTSTRRKHRHSHSYHSSGPRTDFHSRDRPARRRYSSYHSRPDLPTQPEFRSDDPSPHSLSHLRADTESPSPSLSRSSSPQPPQPRKGYTYPSVSLSLSRPDPAQQIGHLPGSVPPFLFLDREQQLQLRLQEQQQERNRSGAQPEVVVTGASHAHLDFGTAQRDGEKAPLTGRDLNRQPFAPGGDPHSKSPYPGTARDREDGAGVENGDRRGGRTRTELDRDQPSQLRARWGRRRVTWDTEDESSCEPGDPVRAHGDFGTGSEQRDAKGGRPSSRFRNRVRNGDQRPGLENSGSDSNGNGSDSDSRSPPLVKPDFELKDDGRGRGDPVVFSIGETRDSVDSSAYEYPSPISPVPHCGEGLLPSPPRALRIPIKVGPYVEPPRAGIGNGIGIGKGVGLGLGGDAGCVLGTGPGTGTGTSTGAGEISPSEDGAEIAVLANKKAKQKERENVKAGKKTERERSDRSEKKKGKEGEKEEKEKEEEEGGKEKGQSDVDSGRGERRHGAARYREHRRSQPKSGSTGGGGGGGVGLDPDSRPGSKSRNTGRDQPHPRSRPGVHHPHSRSNSRSYVHAHTHGHTHTHAHTPGHGHGHSHGHVHSRHHPHSHPHHHPHPHHHNVQGHPYGPPRARNRITKSNPRASNGSAGSDTARRTRRDGTEDGQGHDDHHSHHHDQHQHQHQHQHHRHNSPSRPRRTSVFGSNSATPGSRRGSGSSPPSPTSSSIKSRLSVLALGLGRSLGLGLGRGLGPLENKSIAEVKEMFVRDVRELKRGRW